MKRFLFAILLSLSCLQGYSQIVDTVDIMKEFDEYSFRDAKVTGEVKDSTRIREHLFGVKWGMGINSLTVSVDYDKKPITSPMNFGVYYTYYHSLWNSISLFGIETGLDTNARKNRSGHIMENTVARIFSYHGISFRQEVYSSEFPKLSVLGTDEKRFDFFIETPKKKYLIEVNFYSGGGSKLNEVARAYTDLAPKVNSVEGFEFVWITDGIGWKSARNKLEEAYNTIPSVYNLTNIKQFIDTIKG